MRHVPLPAALAICILACGCATQSAAPASFMLLSWKSSSGRWYYSLRANGKEEVSARTDTEHRVNNVAALKRRLAQLPAGTHVNWSKYHAIGFDYPPEKVIVDVRQFTQQRGLYMYFNFVTEE